MSDERRLTLLSRFQGCLVGAVCGDCIGAKFECLWSGLPVEKVVQYVQQIDNMVAEVGSGQPPVDDKGKPVKKGFILHTDDSCMTLDLAKSLVSRKGFDPMHVVKHFSKTFQASSNQRNYGRHVRDVLDEIADNKFKGDPWGPAKKQFDGSGSYGNGSAMRVSPVVLFTHGDAEAMAKLAAQQSKLTHTHPWGLDGAILQSLAIEKAIDCEKITDAKKFCSDLVEELKNLSENKEKVNMYEEKLSKVNDLLSLDRPVTIQEIEKDIGTNVTAQQAVPASIFCFLYVLEKEKVPELAGYNGLVRTIVYASAVCRDSDTIASMAGAIAGAYYGLEAVPPEWMIACEEAEFAVKVAKDLYRLNRR